MTKHDATRTSFIKSNHQYSTLTLTLCTFPRSKTENFLSPITYATTSTCYSHPIASECSSAISCTDYTNHVASSIPITCSIAEWGFNRQSTAYDFLPWNQEQAANCIRNHPGHNLIRHNLYTCSLKTSFPVIRILPSLVILTAISISSQQTAVRSPLKTFITTCQSC